VKRALLVLCDVQQPKKKERNRSRGRKTDGSQNQCWHESANWNHDWFITVYEKNGSVVREKNIYIVYFVLTHVKSLC
jgi:hypothetical protein